VSFLPVFVQTLLAALPLAVAAFAFFGFPLPSDWRSVRGWLSAIDRWIINHAKYPGLFAIALGMALAVIAPNLFRLVRSQLIKSAYFETIPTHYVGFGGSSQAGYPFETEYINLIVCLKNSGTLASGAENWQAELVLPSGKRVKGIPVYITTDIEMFLPGRFHYRFPPAQALYAQTTASIDEGKTICGPLEFEMDGLPAATVDLDSVLVISVKDWMGNQFVSKTVLKDLAKNTRLFPQLQPFLVQDN
jgi:hypothetical protein